MTPDEKLVEAILDIFGYPRDHTGYRSALKALRLVSLPEGARIIQPPNEVQNND